MSFFFLYWVYQEELYIIKCLKDCDLFLLFVFSIQVCSAVSFPSFKQQVWGKCGEIHRSHFLFLSPYIHQRQCVSFFYACIFCGWLVKQLELLLKMQFDLLWLWFLVLLFSILSAFRFGLCPHLTTENRDILRGSDLLTAYYNVDYLRNLKGTNYWRNRWAPNHRHVCIYVLFISVHFSSSLSE